MVYFNEHENGEKWGVSMQKYLLTWAIENWKGETHFHSEAIKTYDLESYIASLIGSRPNDSGRHVDSWRLVFMLPLQTDQVAVALGDMD